MSRPSRRGAVLVALLALVWGSNFLWIKVALDGLSPLQITFARMATGALVLGILVRTQADRVPRDRSMLAHLAIAALFGNVLPYLLFAIAEQTVDSAVAGVLNATTPLWTVVVALLAHQEPRPSAIKVTGLMLGFIGTLLIFEPWRDSLTGSVSGQLAALGAAACYGIAYVYMARFLTPRLLSPIVLAYGQLVAATVLLFPTVPIAAGESITLSASVVWAMVALGPIGTGVAYVLNYAIITREGATIASTVTYLLPIVAVVLGAAVLDEAITAGMAIGTLVVLAGVALARRKTARSGSLLVATRSTTG
jgi:drug/metabolite transporter (DMT)-like permease